MFPQLVFPPMSHSSKVRLSASFVFWSVCLCVSFSGVAQADVRLFPSEVQLTGTESSQQLLLQSVDGDQVKKQLTEGIEWTSADPNIAKVDSSGRITPVANGNTTVSAKTDGQKAVSVQIHVNRNGPARFLEHFATTSFPR